MTTAVLLMIFLLMTIGNYVPFVGLLALRLSTLAALGWILLFKGKGLPAKGAAAQFITLGLIWVTWGIALTLNSSAQIDSLRELISLSLGFSLSILVFLLLQQQKHQLQAIMLAWLVSVYLACGIGFWELLSGQHLQSSYLDSLPEYALNSSWAMSTFGNPNNFSAFLLLAAIFLLHGYAKSQSKILKIINFVGLSLSCYFIFLASSRLALAGMILAIATHATLNTKKKFRRLLTISSSVIFLAAILPSEITDSIPPLSDAIDQLGFGDLDNNESALERKAQTLNGIEMIIRTNGFGVGPANFSAIAESLDMPYRLRTPNPHNFFLEIASQYGIFVLIFFIITLFRIFRPAIHTILSNYSGSSDSAKLLFLGALTYPIACLSNSSFIAQPTNWIFLGVILSIHNQLVSEKSQAK